MSASDQHRQELEALAADTSKPNTTRAGARQMLDNMDAHAAAGTPTTETKGKLGWGR